MDQSVMHDLAVAAGAAAGLVFVTAFGNALIVIAGKHDTWWGEWCLRLGTALLKPKAAPVEPNPPA